MSIVQPFSFQFFRQDIYLAENNFSSKKVLDFIFNGAWVKHLRLNLPS